MLLHLTGSVYKDAIVETDNARMKELWRKIGLLIFSVGAITFGGKHLQEWHGTGHLKPHSGLRRPICYSTDPFLFVWEFAASSLVIALGLAGLGWLFYSTLSRWGRRSR